MNDGNVCAGWKPIRPTSKDVDVISQKLNDQLLEHNLHGKTLCGWRAGR